MVVLDISKLTYHICYYYIILNVTYYLILTDNDIDILTYSYTNRRQHYNDNIFDVQHWGLIKAFDTQLSHRYVV